MKFRGASRVQALVSKHRHLLPLNLLLTTVVTDMEFSEILNVSWNGIDPLAFSEWAEQMAIKGAVQQRWMGFQQ